MSRRLRISLISAGVVLFLLVSFLLARFLAVENVERDAVLGLLRAQARGDAAAMLATLRDCRDTCPQVVRVNAGSLRGPGQVTILNDKSATAYSLGGATGKTRIAWKLPNRLPVVQCVLVRRRGSVLRGLQVTLLSLSAPIDGTADC
ncbi:MAG: hypothetical protein QOF77_1796 [Solirubrobacteraceae bacterium]|jgi:hypothetical protein|nr:hypothetical protein [Solirubrobacteraceae bacterium]